jgi:DNA-binding HxlR family transcriptional regulator
MYTLRNGADMRIEKQNSTIIMCPAQATLEVLGGKWKGLILFHLSDGTKRFNQLQRLIPSATQRMLTKQLRELEEDKIVHRKIFQEIPPKVEYSLTKFGLTLLPMLEALHAWGKEYIDEVNKIRNNG